MTDNIIKLGESIIQHGESNNRVYLMKLSKVDYPYIINQIHDLTKKNCYTKIFAKVPQWAKEGFQNNGYRIEALIPNFFKGTEDVYFMSYYFDSLRKMQTNIQKAEQIIDFAKKVQPLQTKPQLASNYRFGILTEQDTDDMVAIYKRVFQSYPFPIYDSEYLKQTMNENVVYFGVKDKDKGNIAAIASCEMDIVNQNVEMTDFATLEEHRAKGLSSFLLSEMENEMIKRGMLTAYTIARCMSYGMNITFAKHHYIFSGTLVNNTNISGSIESMNVWYKAL